MYTVGIDLGGTIIKVGLVHEGCLVDQCTLEANSSEGLGMALGGIEQTVDGLMSRNGLDRRELQGVGVAFSGQVDVNAQRVCGTNGKYEDADRIDLREWIYDCWGCDFFIDNDARMMAVGEWKYGAGRGCDDLVTMTLGTGIGTAVIVDGRLIRGKHSQFGCLGGHFTVRHDGRLCSCGNRGCVEAESGSQVLPTLARERSGFEESALAREKRIDYETLFRLATAGDTFSRELCEHCMSVWGAAVVTYIHAYDPQMVILGGGIMNSAEIILPYLERYVADYAWTPHHKVLLRYAELGSTAAILGCSYCLLNRSMRPSYETISE